MTDPGGVLMGRAEPERAPSPLVVGRGGIVADLFVVGGAAMALAVR